MDVREKLVELFYDNNMICDQKIEGLADDVMDIIANRVAVQEWISVKDRLPEDSGYYLVAYRDKYNESTSIDLDYYVKCGAGEWWANEFTHNISHWMPLPEPPKGE